MPAPFQNALTAFNLTVTASAQQIPSGVLLGGLSITAPASNAAAVKIGGATVGTGNVGYLLAPGFTVSLNIPNANFVWFVGTANDVLTVIGN